ncbi:MAG: exo-alpha-sialidase [Gemmataceae bacterium]
MRECYAAFVAFWGIAFAPARDIVQRPVFESGKEGYHTFRIPSLLVTPKGTLLAFCEGRKNSSSDTGDIDLVLKRSTDGGKTWGPMQIVWDDGANTCGNPCPVVDRKTGVIWLLLTHNFGADTEAKIVAGTSKGKRTVWVAQSEDDGLTWSRPVEITKDVSRPDWTWYATGPGVGIQTKSGRLVVPCDNKLAGTKAKQAHVIYSDDAGNTWKLGGVVGPGCNESQIVELSDGALNLNIRSYRGGRCRLVALSNDGGASFGEPVEDKALVEPVCQASILGHPGKPGFVLFSNPASRKRENMTVRLSTDDARTWSGSLVLHAGPAAYSCLAVLSDGSIACLYERGVKNAYETITLATFPLAALKAAGALPPADEKTPYRLFAMDTGLRGPDMKTVEDRVLLLKKLGYSGIGYTFNPAELHKLLELLDKHGLELSALYTSPALSDKADPALVKALPLLKGRKTRIELAIRRGATKGEDGDKQAIAMLKELSDLVGDSGPIISIYPHIGFFTSTETHGLRLVLKVDRKNVKTHFNLYHSPARREREAMEGFLKDALPYIGCVTINGLDGKDRIVPLDQGDYDVEAFVRMLNRVGYRGPIGLQAYAVPGPSAEHLARSKKRWDEIVGKLAK